MKSKGQALVITPEQMDKIKTPLSESWKKAAGILKNKKLDPIKYQQKIRQEWDERAKDLYKKLQEKK